MSELNPWVFMAYWITKDDLELLVFLPLPLKCWGRCTPPPGLVWCWGWSPGFLKASQALLTTELRPSLDVLYNSPLCPSGNKQPSSPIRFCDACFERENSHCPVPQQALTAALSLSRDQFGARCLPYHTQLLLSDTDQKQGEA